MDYTNCTVVYEDELGIFFKKYDERDREIGITRPEEMDFKKEETAKIYVYKNIQNPEKLQDEQVFFEMELKFAFPEGEGKKWKNCYFYKAKSGKVFLRDFDSAICQEVGINSELVTRGEAKKLPENSMIPKNAPIFRINPTNGELERELSSSNVW